MEKTIVFFILALIPSLASAQLGANWPVYQAYGIPPTYYTQGVYVSADINDYPRFNPFSLSNFAGPSLNYNSLIPAPPPATNAPVCGGAEACGVGGDLGSSLPAAVQELLDHLSEIQNMNDVQDLIETNLWGIDLSDDERASLKKAIRDELKDEHKSSDASDEGSAK